MATTKVTFTLDQATVTRIQEAAECLSIPKSEVVREAVQEFFDKIERLTDRKRLKMLRAFDKVIPLIPNRDIRKRSRSCGLSARLGEAVAAEPSIIERHNARRCPTPAEVTA